MSQAIELMKFYLEENLRLTGEKAKYSITYESEQLVKSLQDKSYVGAYSHFFV